MIEAIAAAVGAMESGEAVVEACRGPRRECQDVDDDTSGLEC